MTVQHYAVRCRRLDLFGVDRQRLQSCHGEEKQNRQRGEQDVQGDLIGGFLPVRTFDESDHPVDEAFAGLLGDPDDDSIGENLGSAGDRGPVPAGLPDHRR